MPKLRTAVPCALTALLLLAACNSGDDSKRSDDSSGEPATARGLAAAVLAHLDDADQARVTGSDKDDRLVAIVSPTGDDVTSVFVSVTDEGDGGRTCEPDDGFEIVDCDEGPPFGAVMQKAHLEKRTPVYLGRAEDESRGAVLIEVFGKPSEEGLQLVKDLVADPLVGLETSGALNAKGEKLDNFDDFGDFDQSDVNRDRS